MTADQGALRSMELEPCQPEALAQLPSLSASAAAWVRLIDRAEAAMYPTHAHGTSGEPRAPSEPGEYTQRAASSLWDAVYQVGHTLTPTERIHARAYLWLRDKAVPLPTRGERAELGWALCPCTRCRYVRLTTTTRQQLADCTPEAERQYARVAALHLSLAYRVTHDSHVAAAAHAAQHAAQQEARSV